MVASIAGPDRDADGPRLVIIERSERWVECPLSAANEVPVAGWPRGAMLYAGAEQMHTHESRSADLRKRRCSFRQVGPMPIGLICTC